MGAAGDTAVSTAGAIHALTAQLTMIEGKDMGPTRPEDRSYAAVICRRWGHDTDMGCTSF